MGKVGAIEIGIDIGNGAGQRQGGGGAAADGHTSTAGGGEGTGTGGQGQGDVAGGVDVGQRRRRQIQVGGGVFGEAGVADQTGQLRGIVDRGDHHADVRGIGGLAVRHGNAHRPGGFCGVLSGGFKGQRLQQ